MPMKWGPIEDNVILVTLLQQTEVKLSNAIYQTIATELGVTPKAVSHRIANIKKMVAEKGLSASAIHETEDAIPAKKRKRAAKDDGTPTKKPSTKKVIKAEIDAGEDVEAEDEVDVQEAE